MLISRVLYLLFIIVWTAVLFAFGIGKIVQDGMLEYVSHYTDWNWTINSLFFLFCLIAELLNIAGNDTLSQWSVIYLYWAANGSSWLVFWLVFVMFSENSNLIVDLSVQGGGKYELGFLLNMNTVFHTLPAFCVVIFTMAARKTLTRAMITAFTAMNKPLFVIYGFISILSPLYFIGIYQTFFDIREIYGITMNIFILATVAFGIVMVVNGLTFLLFYYRAKETISRRRQKWEVSQLQERLIQNLPHGYASGIYYASNEHKTL